MRQQEVTWTDPQEALYWRAVRATMREIFDRDPSLAAPLENAFRRRPALERQALYNAEPLDTVADFLEQVPTESQRLAYAQLSATLGQPLKPPSSPPRRQTA